MKNDELISIIVPAYNLEEYILGTIQSILNQDYPYFELIIVNDGSTDSTGRICDDLVKADPRICVIHQSNKGVSAARNAGIRKACGKYITFIDADDAVRIDYLSKLMSAFRNSEVDVVSCAYIDAFSLSERDTIAATKDTNQISFSVCDSIEIQKKLLSHSFSPSACERLYRMDSIKDIWFWEGKKYNEDKYFLFQVLNKSTKVAILDYNGYICLNRATSASRDMTQVNFDAIVISEKILQDINDIRSDELLKYASLNYNLTLLYKARQIVRSSIDRNEKKDLFRTVRRKLLDSGFKKLSVTNTIEKIVLLFGWVPYSVLVKIFERYRIR